MEIGLLFEDRNERGTCPTFRKQKLSFWVIEVHFYAPKLFVENAARKEITASRTFMMIQRHLHEMSTAHYIVRPSMHTVCPGVKAKHKCNTFQSTKVLVSMKI